MRFCCEVRDRECVVEAETPEHATQLVAQEQARLDEASAGATAPPQPRVYTITVAEANEADLPLIAGQEYTITIPASPSGP